MSERSSTEAGSPTGLFAGLKNFAATLVATGRTRLELLANEVEEEKLRALRLLLLALGMVFCAGLAVLLGVAFIAFAFRENALAVVGGFAVFFLLLTGFLLLALQRAVQRPDRAFAASLAELEEDLRQLKASVGEEAVRKAAEK